MRTPVRSQRRSNKTSMQAPIEGLVVTNTGKRTRGARVVENWFPTTRGLAVRGGRTRVATLPSGVTSVDVFTSSGVSKAFASTETVIYDVTALDDASPLDPVVTGQTSGDYSSQQVGTVGGNYLYMLNGTDEAQLFDGTTWQAVNGTSSPISITGVSTENLSQVWLYRNRLFFVREGTKIAYYLPIDAVGGAASDISLAGVFQKGGSLLLGATWSIDSGAGVDDKCVFISTEGEIAIYSGNDPSDAANWSLQGLYQVGRPLGKKCVMQAGGDLIIATRDGIVPLTQVIQKDPAALSMTAVTRDIEPLWTSRSSGHTQLVKWTDRNLALALTPEYEETLTVNLQTGAWASQTNWSFCCGALFEDEVYVGDTAGGLFLLDDGGTDDGEPFTARYCGSFDEFGNPVDYKQMQMMRVTFNALTSVPHNVGVSFNDTIKFPAPPSADAGVTDAFLEWNVSNWNEAVWFSERRAYTDLPGFSEWRGLTGGGQVVAPMVQVASAAESKILAEMIRMDVIFETGGALV